MCSFCCTWFYGGCDGGLGLPHPLHHTFQLFGSCLWGQLWGLHDGIVGMIHPERHQRLQPTTQLMRSSHHKHLRVSEVKEDNLLQRSVSKHDPVEGQGPGHRILLNELHKGETRWLSLVSCHAHKLHISHLLEELQQLICSGGLRTERKQGIIKLRTKSGRD